MERRKEKVGLVVAEAISLSLRTVKRENQRAYEGGRFGWRREIRERKREREGGRRNRIIKGHNKAYAGVKMIVRVG